VPLRTLATKVTDLMGTTQPDTASTAILIIHCPDSRGIVAAVTQLLNEHDGNIVYLDQHVDQQRQLFLMRIEWELHDFAVSLDEFSRLFEQRVAQRYDMQWRLHRSYDTPRMAVFVSKLSHCLYDILARYRTGEWRVEIPIVISNHPDMQDVVKRFGVDYRWFQLTKENKQAVEHEMLTLLSNYNIDFVVLARYMQILSEGFVERYPNRIINIHHSFLPAFPGAKPYHSAHKRGVKIIGATSHYVTAELDAGPIIEQDVVRVTHADTVRDFLRKGRDLEKVVLARAIRAHIKRKILVYDNKTVVFV